MTSKFTARTARRCAATVGLAALVASVSGLAGAAGASAAETPLAGPAQLTDFEHGFNVWMTDGTKTDAGLFELTVNATKETIEAYCIENRIHTNEKAHYYLWSWNDYTSQTKGWGPNKGKILSILLHSTPHLSTADVLAAAKLPATKDTSSDHREIIAATQAAIWHLTDGLDLDKMNTGPRVYALYEYLLGAADPVDSDPSTRLEFSSAASGVAGTLTGPITLKGTSPAQVNVTLPNNKALPSGFKLFTDAAGTKEATNGGTYAPGTSFYVSVPKDAEAGQVSFHAAGSQKVAVGSVWDSTADGISTQALITAKESMVELSADGAMAWTAAPKEEPTPQPTTPGSGTPTTTPGDDTTTTPGDTTTPGSGTTTPTTPAPVVTTPTTPAPVVTTPTTPAPVVTTPSTPAPVVTTPAPKPTAPTTPKPAPTAPTKPTKPTKPATPVKPGKPVSPSTPAMVTRTFQVDRYLPRTAAQAATVARLDDDGRLGYREDRALWGASRHQFVTVTVPVNATKAQVVAAIDAKTNAAVGDVTTLAKLGSASAGRGYTIAWELGRGATPKLAWGAQKNIAQTFFARS